jgi:holliday junction DNA helicase RuvA
MQAMIGYLRGKVIDVEGNDVVLDVNGVGYLLGVSAALAKQMAVGSEVELQVHMQVAEKVLALFGFADREQLEFFRMLLTVDGVGPKGALAVLGAGSTSEVKEALAGNQIDFFKKAHGVGPKTLQKIVVELAGKLKGARGVPLVRTGTEAVVESGLLGLGFKADQVKTGLAAVDWASKPDAKAAMQTALAALRH